MAYYNPQRVDFNPNTMTIQAVGSVGRSLWDIYKHNVEKGQAQAKLDETNRSNLASEAQAAANLAETARSHYASEKQRADELDQKKIFNNAQINHWGNQDKILGFNADTSRMNANTAAANFGLNRDKFAYQQKTDAAKLNDSALQTDMALNALGITLPQEIQNLPQEVQLAYKKALLGVNTPNGNVYQALKDRGVNPTTGEISIKKKQPTQKERETIAQLQALGENLVNAKLNFTGGEQGGPQNFIHWLAKGIGAQNIDTANFKEQIGTARQQAKSLLDGGRVSNVQYADLLKNLPDPNAWTDKDYQVQNDATLNHLLNTLTTKIQTLRDSGIDTSEMEETLLPFYDKVYNRGYFYNDHRWFDASGKRLNEGQNNQASQNSGFVPKGVDNNATNTNQNVKVLQYYTN
jgi:hypothetical protein|nr:MAG TPA: hypothetical protein [Caudoviricetes sp.]